MSQLPIKRYFYQVQNETENSMSAPRPRPSNRDLLRSGGNRQHHKKYYKEIQTIFFLYYHTKSEFFSPKKIKISGS